MNIRKVALSNAIILLSFGLTACSGKSSSNPASSNPVKISLTQASKSKTNRKAINKRIASNLQKDTKRAKNGNDDYNYALYVYKVILEPDGSAAAAVDSTNFSKLPTDQIITVGQKINKLIDRSLISENVRFDKSKGIYLTVCNEDGNIILPEVNYKTGKYKDKQLQKKAEQDAKTPVEYRNALDKAQNYSDNMHMSKQGIYDQLTSEVEGFSKQAATYAINNVKADWNKNALEKAKSYQKDQKMSTSSIKDQLTSAYGEQFTDSQAQYAIDHLPK